MKQNFKSILMIVAMFFGFMASSSLSKLDAYTDERLTPSMLFFMLYITFCCIDIRKLKLSLIHIYILLFQVIVGIVSYYSILPFSEVLAQGTMICVVMPVAMAAVALGAMIGANAALIATYSLLCNTAMALFIPMFFSRIGGVGCTYSQILGRVVPIMVLPLICAQLTRWILPKFSIWLGRHSQISFYLWVSSLIITMARTTTYLRNNITDIDISIFIALAISSLVTCIAQFRIGALLGKKTGDESATQQSLGQKNTILAIWLAQSYLLPAASIAPTAYVVWQNLVNSYSIYRYNKSKREKQSTR